VLVPEMCVAAYQREAIGHGADLRFGDGLQGWMLNTETDLYELTTDSGSVFYAKKLVLSVGAWASSIYGSALPFNLTVERRVLHWFDPTPSEQTMDNNNNNNNNNSAELEQFRNIPVYLWDTEGKQPLYGFPLQQGKGYPDGLKVALHAGPNYPNSSLSKAEDLQSRREVGEEEVEEIREYLREKIPLLGGGKHVTSAACMYTFTPNEHFLLDWHPQHDQRVLLVSPCSGHGFKFGSVMGHCCASLLTKGQYDLDISFFGIDKHRSSLVLAAHE
jgi:sarcosine oxidase